MPNEGLVNVGKCAYFSVPGGVTLSGWPRTQEPSFGGVRKLLIMRASSHLMGCLVEWECLARAGIAISHLHTD